MNPIYLTEILDEILGVPEGLVETAKEIYEEVIKQIRENGSIPLKSRPTITFTVRNMNGFNVSDYKFTTVNVEVEVIDNPYGIEFKGMGFKFIPSLNAPYKNFTKKSTNIVDLAITLSGFLSSLSWEDIADYLDGNKKVKLMSSFAHELKHAYDAFKKPEQSASSTIKYRTTTELMQPLPGLREFMFYLYFTTLTENLVRASEVAAYLKYKGTTKEDFLKTLEETEVYSISKLAQSFTYDKMIQDIINDPNSIPSIKKFYKTQFQTNLDDLSDEDIANEFLKMHFSQMKKRMVDLYKMNVNKLGPLDMMFSQWGYKSNEVDQEKENAIKEFEKTINKYSDEDYEKFYRREIAQINFNAGKILRKVAKLYAYI